jgi:hypothetical protein
MAGPGDGSEPPEGINPERRPMPVFRFQIRALMIAVAVVAVACWSVVSLGIPWPFLFLAASSLLGIGRVMVRARRATPVSGGALGGAVGGLVLAVGAFAYYWREATFRRVLGAILILAFVGWLLGAAVELCVRFVVMWARNQAKIEELRRRHERP